MQTIHAIETIVSDPNVRDGQAMIRDSQVRVVDVIASHLYRHLSADELATNFNLSLGQIYATLAYYYQHKAHIDAILRDEARQADAHLKELEAQGKLIRRD
jgi:uncharacterized protein (DUF433 family)